MRGLELGLGLTRYGVASAVITPPVLAFAAGRVAGSQISFGAGGNANITVDATVTSGMYWQIEIASNNTFTAPLAGEGAIRTETRQIGAQDFITGPEFTSLVALPNGLTYIRVRVSDDSARVSAWSNSLTDTIASAVTKFHTTNGANKNSKAVVSGSDLVVSYVDGGNAGAGVRTTQQPAADKTQFEATVTAISGSSDCYIFVEDGTTNLGPTTEVTPDYTANKGVRVSLNATFGGAVWGGGADAFFGSTINVGDVIIVEITKSTGVMKFWHKRGGTTTLVATKTRILSAYYVSCHTKLNTNSFTFNFGATAFVRTPDSGVVAYNG